MRRGHRANCGSPFRSTLRNRSDPLTIDRFARCILSRETINREGFIMPESQPPLGSSVPLVPPLYQSSVYTLPDLDALDRIMDARAPGFIYARDGHPNARQLADQLAH